MKDILKQFHNNVDELQKDITEENVIYLKMKESEIYAELNSKRLTACEVYDDIHEIIDNL